MIDSTLALKAIACMAGVTVLLRAIPFIGAARLQKLPLLLRLGRFLPPAIMTLLLLHSVHASMGEHAAGAWWPPLLAAACAIALQWRTRQPLLSILAATGLYVLLLDMRAFL